MGSVADGKATKDGEFTVLVTGFAPFRTEYPVNPSWEIASRLPTYLPSEDKATATTSSSPPTLTHVPLPPVRIVVYPEPVRVNYRTVRALVPTLWDGGTAAAAAAAKTNAELTTSLAASTTTLSPPFRPPARIDVLLHIGMAGPRLHYALERVGRRDGYMLPDVDDELLGDTPADRADPAWPWYGVPAALETHIDLDDVLARWRTYTTATDGTVPDLRISVDAGRYLCDFIYFSSLAHLFRRDADADGHDPRYHRRRVVFLHVPAAATPERITAGRDLVVALIRALVEVEVAAAADGAKGKKSENEDVEEQAPLGANMATGKWYRE